jgi:hypothetical protein
MWRLDFQVDYGKMDSEYGLVIDHIKPVSEGVRTTFQTFALYIGRIPHEMKMAPLYAPL